MSLKLSGDVLNTIRSTNGTMEFNRKHNPFRLELETSSEGSLPEIIADDLMEDPESPIAPVLQIILKKLWETASAVNDPNSVKFTIQQYQELRKQGTTMSEFFQEQMEKLAAESKSEQEQKKRKTIQKAVASGLVLDLLHAHTTGMGTAGSCRRRDLLAHYELPDQVIDDLLKELQNLSLLIQIRDETPSTNTEDTDYTTILSHDTLAPVVIQEYNLSDAPGQRAARILANKMADVGFRFDPALVKAWEKTKQISKESLTDFEREYTGAP